MSRAEIELAVQWLLKQKPAYGEAGLKLIFHDGELRRIEKSLTEKEQ